MDGHGGLRFCIQGTKFSDDGRIKVAVSVCGFAVDGVVKEATGISPGEKYLGTVMNVADFQLPWWRLWTSIDHGDIPGGY